LPMFHAGLLWRCNGVCLVQTGPGSENQFAGVAQAFADSVPILLLPCGYDRRELRRPQFCRPGTTIGSVTKSVEYGLLFADQIPTLMRRAFVLLRTGRPGPVMIEIPAMLLRRNSMMSCCATSPVKGWRPAGDQADVKRVASALIGAKNPVIRAGNGILICQCWMSFGEFARAAADSCIHYDAGEECFP